MWNEQFLIAAHPDSFVKHTTLIAAQKHAEATGARKIYRVIEIETRTPGAFTQKWKP